MRSLSRAVRLFTLSILLMLCTGLYQVSAAGSREDRLPEASALVDERRYNDAMLILTEILRKEPERLDEVQIVLNRIYDEKKHYNDRYEDLIETYGGDKVEEAYPIIKELEELDPNPNEATRRSLVLARETAGFVFNRNRWTGIMDDALKLISEGSIPEAINLYRSGFDLSRDIFNDYGYGSIIVNNVYSRAERLDELSKASADLYVELFPYAESAAASASSGDVAGLENAFMEMEEGLIRLADYRSEMESLADYFVRQEEAIRQSMGDDKQVHYLIYLDRLVRGRTSEDYREGINGAVDSFWESASLTVSDGLREILRSRYAGAEDLYNNRRYSEAAALLAGFDESAETAARAAGLLSAYAYIGEDGGLFTPLTVPVETAAEASLDVSALSAAAGTLAELIEEETSYTGIRGRIGGLESREEEPPIRTAISEHNSKLGQLQTRWVLLSGKYADAEEAGLDVDTARAAAVFFSERIDELESESLNDEIRLAAESFGLALESISADYENQLKLAEESRILVYGDGEAPEQQPVLKYPDRALEVIAGMRKSLDAISGEILSLTAEISAERAEIRAGAPVEDVSGGASGIRSGVAVLLGEISALEDTASANIFNAQKFRQEGERRIQESRTMSRAADFAAAKTRLEQASERFDQALALQEDAALRSFRDTEIPRLYEEIQAAENNLVVRQVREYLNSAKVQYSQGNFAQAQNVLIKAQNRWADTNVEVNAEVEYWLTLTKTALSVTSGRVIAQTDPLYAEMSQYLNQARTDFLKAREELDGGRRNEAAVYFEKAEQSILYVQQFFPFNEEARILNLRISQYRDRERFEELFRNDFNTARRLIGENPQKAYIDLKDLEAINPAYPGLKTAITEAEYAAGIKVRPPDAAKLKRSAELYERAFSIVSRNVRSEYSVALTYLDEAINLNPDNLEAVRLKDRLAADVGGTATVVMSSADKKLYQDAVNEYTAGNYLKARIIVENLLKNPDNRRNTRILDLKERLDTLR